MRDFLEGIVAGFVVVTSVIISVFTVVFSLAFALFLLVICNPLAWIVVILILILNKMG